MTITTPWRSDLRRPSARSDAIFSIALYPRWVSLFFLMNGTKLRDPECYLKGSGKVVRHIVLENAALLDDPVVQDLMAQALELSPHPIDSRAAAAADHQIGFGEAAAAPPQILNLR